MHASLYLLDEEKSIVHWEQLGIQENVRVYFYSESSLCADSTVHIRSDVNRKGFKEYKARCLGSTTSEEDK